MEERVGEPASRTGRAGTVFVLLAVPVLMACSTGDSKKTFDEAMARAAVTAEVTDTRDTRKYAPAELAIANEKLVAARQAAQSGDQREADRMLAEALVNIELAKAKTAAGRVKAEAAELGDGRPERDSSNVQRSSRR